MSNQDRKLLEVCINGGEELSNAVNCEFPLDKEMIGKLEKLKDGIPEDSDVYEIFKHRNTIDELWVSLLERAIKCLRFYDKREPFKESDGKKVPKAYGIAELKAYYEKYSEFERVLYGSSKYYRDHVIHVFRTWMSGIELLTKNSNEMLEKIDLHEKGIPVHLEFAEKISIWTIIALTHDLGYPLQKSKDIIDVTQKMVGTFITNPDISVDFSFHGVQNYMNDFIVRLMSSKMKKHGEETIKDENGEDKNVPVYVARLQPKYYFKFQKSLERNDHGILSTLIIYKLLTYFLESDYNINEDYTFDGEDCRQFYIRREILRAIASHTCSDVYQLYMGSFSFLLRICDDTQEWGRKYISELYVQTAQKYELEDIDMLFKDEKQNECKISERIEASGKNEEEVAQLLCRFHKQAQEYVTIFRDGQDTEKRDFSFTRSMEIIYDRISFKLMLNIRRDDASKLTVETTYRSSGAKNKVFGLDYFEKSGLPIKEFKLFDDDGNEADLKKTSSWRKGTFSISLTE